MNRKISFAEKSHHLVQKPWQLLPTIHTNTTSLKEFHLVCWLKVIVKGYLHYVQHSSYILHSPLILLYRTQDHQPWTPQTLWPVCVLYNVPASSLLKNRRIPQG